MKKVSHLLLQKELNVIYSTSPDMYVLDGLTVMLEKNISALLIIDQEKLVGIFTERDYARKIILLGRSSKDTTIAEVMTRDLITISKEDSVEYCMKIMTEKHIRHLPVLENEKAVGMISIGDVVKSVIEDQKQIIQHLEGYISG